MHGCPQLDLIPSPLSCACRTQAGRIHTHLCDIVHGGGGLVRCGSVRAAAPSGASSPSVWAERSRRVALTPTSPRGWGKHSAQATAKILYGRRVPRTAHVPAPAGAAGGGIRVGPAIVAGVKRRRRSP